MAWTQQHIINITKEKNHNQNQNQIYSDSTNQNDIKYHWPSIHQTSTPYRMNAPAEKVSVKDKFGIEKLFKK